MTNQWEDIRIKLSESLYQSTTADGQTGEALARIFLLELEDEPETCVRLFGFVSQAAMWRNTQGQHLFGLDEPDKDESKYDMDAEIKRCYHCTHALLDPLEDMMIHITPEGFEYLVIYFMEAHNEKSMLAHLTS